MRIIINDKEINNINKLDSFPAVDSTRKWWGDEDYKEKSAIEISKFLTPFGSISLLFGPRQIGKTASLELFLSQLKDSQTLVYTDCSTILERADLHRHLDRVIQGKTTIVLDEVQEVPGWHLALRALHGKGKLRDCRIWCTGSEARHLLESGERLPGRKGQGRVLYARPWSFREFMHFFYPGLCQTYQAINFRHINQAWLEEQRIDWQTPWQEYCLCGGVPRAVAELKNAGGISDETWRAYADWILGTWSTLRTPARSQSALAKRLCETLNSRVSFEALTKGTDILSPNTVKKLIEIQEDHLSLKTLVRFALDQQKFLAGKQKKIFPIDPFVARVWSTIGWPIRRNVSEQLPALALDECAFASQMQRSEEGPEPSYLYSERRQAEVDFYFEGCAFELKSNGSPSKNQWALLKTAPHWFVVRRQHLPLMAYLVGGNRSE